MQTSVKTLEVWPERGTLLQVWQQLLPAQAYEVVSAVLTAHWMENFAEALPAILATLSRFQSEGFCSGAPHDQACKLCKRQNSKQARSASIDLL